MWQPRPQEATSASEQEERWREEIQSAAHRSWLAGLPGRTVTAVVSFTCPRGMPSGIRVISTASCVAPLFLTVLYCSVSTENHPVSSSFSFPDVDVDADFFMESLLKINP